MILFGLRQLTELKMKKQRKLAHRLREFLSTPVLGIISLHIENIVLETDQSAKDPPLTVSNHQSPIFFVETRILSNLLYHGRELTQRIGRLADQL